LRLFFQYFVNKLWFFLCENYSAIYPPWLGPTRLCNKKNRQKLLTQKFAPLITYINCNPIMSLEKKSKGVEKEKQQQHDLVEIHVLVKQLFFVFIFCLSKWLFMFNFPIKNYRWSIFGDVTPRNCALCQVIWPRPPFL
jgi:hypothetical protein